MTTLNFNSPINELSYGIVSKNFLKNLIKFGVDISLFPIGDIDSFEDKTFYNSSEPVIYDKTLKIWHQYGLHDRIGGGQHFGFPIFELDTFNNVEKASIRSCDNIIVCSDWAKEVIYNNCQIRANVVPLGYDPNIFKPAPILNNSKTIFMNCGKWEYRKGHDVLLECFESAFNANDNVELWMLSENVHHYANPSQWEKKYTTSKLANKIKIIPRQKSQKNVYYIMSKVDCGVFPSRAEGWNLGMLEMMASGRHIIATNYSGHTQFNQKGVNHIEIDAKEIANDGIWFHGQGSWAHFGEPQKEQLINHLRDIHERKKTGNLKENTEAIYNTQKFTWEKCTEKLLEVLYEYKHKDATRLT